GSEQRRARLPRVGVDAEAHRVVAADVLRLDVDLHDPRVGLDRAVVEVARELAEAWAEGEQHGGAATRRGPLGGAGATQRTDAERVLGGAGGRGSVRRAHPTAARAGGSGD